MARRENKKQVKTVSLKQYLIAGGPTGAKRARKAALIVQTCPKLANEEFRRKFPDCDIWNTSLVAETNLTNADIANIDPWIDGRDTVVIDRNSDD